MRGWRFEMWLRTLPGSRLLPWPYLVVGTVAAADEVPDRLSPRTAIVVQPNGRATWLVFDCPHHTDQRIMLNLSTRRRPYWTIGEGSKLTVYPSIDAFHAAGRCHFWMRRGRVRWAKKIKLQERNVDT